MIKLDGSFQEGGGQILRTALALSAITQKPFTIDNIRKNRPEPGLKNQHLYCINALKHICNAKVADAHLGSESITFIPNKIKGGTYSIETPTAASTTLILQALLPVCIFSPSKIKIILKGGTDTKWSPQFDYLNNVFLPQIKKYFQKSDIAMEQRGYYPKGGGKVELHITPKKDKDNLPSIIRIKQGTLIAVKGIAHSSTELADNKVVERMTRAARITLKNKLKCTTKLQMQYSNTISVGGGITLWAFFSLVPEEIDLTNMIILGKDKLAEKGIRSEDIGQYAANSLIEDINTGAAVDKYMADQLIPYLALFGGKIKVSKITEHTRTNIYVCEQFLDRKFNIKEDEKIIEVQQQDL